MHKDVHEKEPQAQVGGVTIGQFKGAKSERRTGTTDEVGGGEQKVQAGGPGGTMTGLGRDSAGHSSCQDTLFHMCSPAWLTAGPQRGRSLSVPNTIEILYSSWTRAQFNKKELNEFILTSQCFSRSRSVRKSIY